MLKSRRGLLAVGLAVAVVGAIGVASTMNASAEQTPGSAAPASSAADAVPAAEAGKPTPPALLPWGARPTKIKKGRPGESSKALAADGLSAAANDTSGRTTPEAVYAPKGRVSGTTYLKSESTDVTPPVPAAVRGSTVAPDPSASSSDGKATMFYAAGSQQAVTDGLSSTLTIAQPALGDNDFHTLGELAAESADGKQIVEVGWNVDPTVNGDSQPHLFVYHWVNHTESCYNGCGFVQYSADVQPGVRLVDTAGTVLVKKFGIQHANGVWWVAYDSEWIGYFPDSLWSDQGVTFQQTGYIQAFGEVAASSDVPCGTEMGTGLNKADVDLSIPGVDTTVSDRIGDDASLAKVGSVTYINGPAVNLNVWSSSNLYLAGLAKGSVRTFRFGGPNPLLCG